MTETNVNEDAERLAQAPCSHDEGASTTQVSCSYDGGVPTSQVPCSYDGDASRIMMTPPLSPVTPVEPMTPRAEPDDVKPWHHRVLVWSLWLAAVLLVSALLCGVAGDYMTQAYPDAVSDFVTTLYDSFSKAGVYDESTVDDTGTGSNAAASESSEGGSGEASSKSGSASDVGQNGSTSSASDEVKLNLIPLFLHNLLVAFLTFVTGFIPFLFIPIFFIFFNGSILGFIGGITVASGTFMQYLVDVLPHGVIELTAFVIAGALGCALLMDIIRAQATRQRREDHARLRADIRKAIINFCAIVIPLLIVAAVIETYVTPLVATSVI